MSKKDKRACKGAIAFCGGINLGLITVDEPILVTYTNGKSAMAWVGIHLTDKKAPLGSPWSAKEPLVVGHVNDYFGKPRRATTCKIKT